MELQQVRAGNDKLYQVQTGVIVDFTVAKKDYQSDHINIYAIEGDKKASMYKLYTKDTFS